MATKTQPGANKTILIADDDRDLAQMLTLRCKQAGFDVFRSPDAMHALLGSQRINPDLIILDIQMPGGNGLSVCEMLSGDGSSQKAPVIVMSGAANEATRLRCQALGARFIEKGTQFWERLEPEIYAALGLQLPARKAEAPPLAAPTPPAAAAPTPPVVRAPAVKYSPAPAIEEPGTPIFVEDEVVPEPAAVEPEPVIESTRPKVLCIDDDPELSKSLKLRLELYGVEVLRAFNGMQGYWSALDMKPDLILLDLLMPGGEGNYIFGRLKMHPLTEKTPVVVLTGQNTPAMRRKMFGLGVDGFLTKPVNFNLLLEMLQQYMTLSSQPAALHAGMERLRPGAQTGSGRNVAAAKESAFA